VCRPRYIVDTLSNDTNCNASTLYTPSQLLRQLKAINTNGQLIRSLWRENSILGGFLADLDVAHQAVRYQPYKVNGEHAILQVGGTHFHAVS
jgi:hypothetical protein